MGNRPSLLELLTVKDRPKEDCEFYRTDVALSILKLAQNNMLVKNEVMHSQP